MKLTQFFVTVSALNLKKGLVLFPLRVRLPLLINLSQSFFVLSNEWELNTEQKRGIQPRNWREITIWPEMETGFFVKEAETLDKKSCMGYISPTGCIKNALQNVQAFIFRIIRFLHNYLICINLVPRLFPKWSISCIFHLLEKRHHPIS